MICFAHYLIEYVLHSSALVEHIDDDFLKEWVPAEARMGFIRGNNLDVYGALLSIILVFTGGIITKLISLIKSLLSVSLKSKKD